MSFKLSWFEFEISRLFKQFDLRLSNFSYLIHILLHLREFLRCNLVRFSEQLSFLGDLPIKLSIFFRKTYNFKHKMFGLVALARAAEIEGLLALVLLIQQFLFRAEEGCFWRAKFPAKCKEKIKKYAIDARSQNFMYCLS